MKNPIVLLSAKVLSVVLALSIIDYFIIREQKSANPEQTPNSAVADEEIFLSASKSSILPTDLIVDLPVIELGDSAIRQDDKAATHKDFTVSKKKVVYPSSSKKLGFQRADIKAWYLKPKSGLDIMLTSEVTIKQLEALERQFPSDNLSFEVRKAKPIFISSSKAAVLNTLENKEAFWHIVVGPLHMERLHDEDLIRLLDKLSEIKPITK